MFDDGFSPLDAFAGVRQSRLESRPAGAQYGGAVTAPAIGPSAVQIPCPVLLPQTVDDGQAAILEHELCVHEKPPPHFVEVPAHPEAWRALGTRKAVVPLVTPTEGSVRAMTMCIWPRRRSR